MKRLLSGALAILIALLAPISTSSAYEVLRTTDGKELRWYDDTISFYINVDGFSDFDAAQLVDATSDCMTTWSRLALGFRFELLGTINVKKAEDDDLNVIFFEQDPIKWEETFKNQDQAFAMTRNWAVPSGSIQGFDMVFNDWRYQFTNSEDPASTVVDYCNTLTHEFGHVLGMDHSADETATMYYSSSSGELSKRDLSNDDVAGIRYLYRDGFAPPAEDGLVGCALSQTGNRSGSLNLVSLTIPAALLMWRRRKSRETSRRLP